MFTSENIFFYFILLILIVALYSKIKFMLTEEKVAKGDKDFYSGRLTFGYRPYFDSFLTVSRVDVSGYILVISIYLFREGNKTISNNLRKGIYDFYYDNYRSQNFFIKKMNEILQFPKIPFTFSCEKIRANVVYAQRLKLIDIIFQIALNEAPITYNREAKLMQLVANLGINIRGVQHFQNKYQRHFFSHQERERKNREEREKHYKQREKSYYKTNSKFVWNNEAYRILGISSEANKEEIRQAYRKLALKYHPDRIDQDDIIRLKIATERFQEIQNAYNKLR